MKLPEVDANAERAGAGVPFQQARLEALQAKLQGDEAAGPPPEEDDAASKKKFYIAGGVLAVLLVLLAALFTFLAPGEEENATPAVESVAITQEDQAAIDALVREFVQIGGSWGVNEEVLNEGNIARIARSSLGDVGVTEAYWRLRPEVYRQVQETYLAPLGPLYYDEASVTTWQDPIAQASLSTFSTTADAVKTAPQGDYVILANEKYPRAHAEVASTTVQTTRVKTADDPSWDGTFRVMEKAFQDAYTVEVIQAKDGTWRVYSIEGSAYPFVNVAQGPQDDYYYAQHDFKDKGSIKGVLN